MNKRRGMVFGVISAYCALVAYSEYNRRDIIESIHFFENVEVFEKIRFFGTIEHPTYLIRAQFTAVDNPLALPFSPAAFEQSSSLVYPSSDWLSSDWFSSDDTYLSSYLTFTSFLDSQFLSDTLLFGLPPVPSLEDEAVEQHGLLYLPHHKEYSVQDIEDFSRQVFQGLTMQRFPDRELIKEQSGYFYGRDFVLGSHFSAINTVAYARMQESYINLETLFHEFGHVIAQYEERSSRFRFFHPAKTNDWRVLEEAAAYGFSNAAAYYLASQEGNITLACDMKKYLDEKIIDHASRYYDGEKDNSFHKQGAAYFLAAFHVLGNPYATFNYLATVPQSRLENISPLIQQQHEANREAYQRMKEHTENIYSEK